MQMSAHKTADKSSTSVRAQTPLAGILGEQGLEAGAASSCSTGLATAQAEAYRQTWLFVRRTAAVEVGAQLLSVRSKGQHALTRSSHATSTRLTSFHSPVWLLFQFGFCLHGCRHPSVYADIGPGLGSRGLESVLNVGKLL